MSGIPTPPIRAVLVDDEPLARSYLKELLAAHPRVQIVAECGNGFEAVKACADLEPDLIFLDIRMPKLDGFEVLELIPGHIQVIFVTAYDQFALRAFEVHAVDYLLKPFSPARLAEALGRVEGPADRGPGAAAQVARAALPPEQHLSRIVVRDGTSVTILAVGDLDYVKAQDDYVALWAGGRSHLKHQTLASLAAVLDPDRFVRIHRSALINIDRLDRVEPYSKDSKLAILKDGSQLPISRAGLKRLEALLAAESN